MTYIMQVFTQLAGWCLNHFTGFLYCNCIIHSLRGSFSFFDEG